MENITIKINGMEVSAPAGSTILEAARIAGIDIPTLCFLKEINEIGACRICVNPAACIFHQSWYGSIHEYSAGEGIQKENSAVDLIHT